MRPMLRPASAALFTMVLVLAACQASNTESPSGSGGPQPSSSATGGTVRIGYGGSPDSVNPGLALLTEAFTMFELVYDTPIAIAPDGTYIPELASSWDVSDDGLTYTLHLVDNAVFHDGTPLTSEDVKFSLETYRDNPDFPYQSSYPDVFTSIEATDPTTVVLHTEEPVGNFEYRMVFMYVLPKHIWENEDPLTFDNGEMIGSGPFKLAEYSQNEFVRLEAVKDHWNQPPNVDEVIFQTISNADARVAALTNGDIDMITEFPLTALSSLQATENVTVTETSAIGGSLRDVFFNLVDPADCPEGGVCSGHPALRDVEVRQALAKAIDKQQIIDVATLGTAAPGLSLVPVGLGDFYLGDEADYAFDPEAAKQQLEDAGYVDANGDGIRECKSGQGCDDLTFRFSYPDDIDTAPREAELIDAMWNEVGVDLQITSLDADTLTSICCPSFDYDVILWGWGSDPDPQFLLGVPTCEGIANGFNETGYCSSAYDDLYAQQAVETDHSARVDIVHQMQQMLVDDVPYIIPYYPKDVQAYRSDAFTGWLEGPTGFGLDDVSSLVVIRPVE